MRIEVTMNTGGLDSNTGKARRNFKFCFKKNSFIEEKSMFLQCLRTTFNQKSGSSGYLLKLLLSRVLKPFFSAKYCSKWLQVKAYCVILNLSLPRQADNLNAKYHQKQM